jgi:hypothetical protein
MQGNKEEIRKKKEKGERKRENKKLKGKISAKQERIQANRAH